MSQESARLLGKSAVITGAAFGIGRATAVLFAREGARLVVTDIQGEPLLALGPTNCAAPQRKSRQSSAASRWRRTRGR